MFSTVLSHTTPKPSSILLNLMDLTLKKSSSKLKAHAAVVFLPLTDYCQEAFEKY